MAGQDDNDQNGPPATGEHDDEQLGEGGKKALQAERTARKKLEDEIKALRPLAKAAKDAEDSKKDEVQRLTEQLATLTKERDSATLTNARYKVALDKGLSLTRAKRLVGDTEEELAADADELLADLGEVNTDEVKPSPTGKPKEHLKPGTNTPDEAAEETDLRKLGEQMFSH